MEDVAIEIAIVDDPPRLELRARQRALWNDLDHGMDAQPGAEAFPHASPEGLQSDSVGTRATVMLPRADA